MVAFRTGIQDRKRTICLGGCVGETGGAQDAGQLASTDDSIDVGNVLLDLIAKTLHQTSGDHQTLGSAIGFMAGHFENGINGFLLRAADERTSVDDYHVCIVGRGGKLSAGFSKEAHHDFAIDQIFRTAQADETDLQRDGSRRNLGAGILRSHGNNQKDTMT